MASNRKNGNGQLQNVAIVIGIVVLGVATLAALVVDESGRVTAALGFLTGLVALLGGALKLGGIQTIVQAANVRTEQTAAKVDQVDVKLDTNTIKTEEVAVKLEAVAKSVDGINSAALVNQKLVSDAAGFNRGVAETVRTVEAVAVAMAPAAKVEDKPPSRQ